MWIGVKDSNTTVVSRACPHGYCRSEKWSVSLNNPDSQCTFNRTGVLCGGCSLGLSLTLGDGHCDLCSDIYLLLFLPFSLPGLMLVIFIKVLDLTVAQGTVNALILYTNIIGAYKYILLKNAPVVFKVFIAWINLDVGVNTCLFDGMTTYSNTWLQFVFPAYIWTIAVGIILAAKYSKRATHWAGNNGVPVLATLFLLSYSKLLQAIITALSYTTVYTVHGSRAVWAADGNLDYLSLKHCVLFAAATTALLFLWLPYTLLLFLGQWLQRCNCSFVSRLMTRLKPFLDAHSAPFKVKHSYWFGTLLLVRVFVLLMSALSPADSFGFAAYAIVILSILLTYSGLLIYRSTAVMMFEASFFVNLGVTALTGLLMEVYGERLSTGVSALIGIAMLQFMGLVVYKICSALGQRCRASLVRKRVSSLGEWQNWEQSQAALLKDIEESQVALLSDSIDGAANYGSMEDSSNNGE